MILEITSEDLQTQFDTELETTSEDVQPQFAPEAEKLSQLISEVQPAIDSEVAALSDIEKNAYIMYLEEKVRVLNAEIAVITTEEMPVITKGFNESKSENKKLIMENYNYEEEIQTLTNSLQNKQIEIEKLSSQINSLTAKLKTLINDANSESFNYEKSIKKLQEKVQSLNGQVKKFSEELTYFKKDNNELLLTKETLQAEITKLKSEIEQKNKQINKLNLSLRALTEMNSTLQNSKLVSEDKLVTVNGEKKILQTEFRDLKEENSSLKTSILSLKKEKEKFEELLRKLTDKSKISKSENITTPIVTFVAQVKADLEPKHLQLKNKEETLALAIEALKENFIITKNKGFKYKFKKFINFICKKLFNKEPFNFITWENINKNEQFKNELAQNSQINELDKEITNLRKEINNIEQSTTLDTKTVDKSQCFNMVKELANSETNNEFAPAKPVNSERVIN